MRGHDDPRPVAVGDGAQRVEGRVVLVVGRQQLVAGLEARASCSTALTPVVAFGTKARPSGIGAEERPDRLAGRVEQPRQLAVEERDGLRSSRSRSSRWTARTGCRAGAERAVVEERDGRVEASSRGRSASAYGAGSMRLAVGGHDGGSARAAARSQRASPSPTTRHGCARPDDDAGPLGQPERRRGPAAASPPNRATCARPRRAHPRAARRAMPGTSPRPATTAAGVHVQRRRAPSPRRSPRPGPRPRRGPRSIAAHAPPCPGRASG